MELFDRENTNYKNQIFNKTKSIFIEAGTKQSWTKYMKQEDIYIGLDNFGLSGPGKDVYKHFQITVDRVLIEAMKVLNIK